MGQLLLSYPSVGAPGSRAILTLSTEAGALLARGTSQVSWPHPSFLGVHKTQVDPADLAGTLVPDTEKAKEDRLAPLPESPPAW